MQKLQKESSEDGWTGGSDGLNLYPTIFILFSSSACKLLGGGAKETPHSPSPFPIFQSPLFRAAPPFPLHYPLFKNLHSAPLPLLSANGQNFQTPPTNFPSLQDNLFPTATENNFIVWNCSFSGPNGIYLFSNDNSRTKCKICSNLIIEAPDIVLVSFILTLNIFGMVLQCLL